jgi:hypothetical protein
MYPHFLAPAHPHPNSVLSHHASLQLVTLPHVQCLVPVSTTQSVGSSRDLVRRILDDLNVEAGNPLVVITQV